MEEQTNFPIIVPLIGRVKKILIIRFSSIGDIVLTSPVPRILKQQFPELEIHYLSKASFKDILLHNPYISQLHWLEKDNKKDIIHTLKSENFNYIIDLQRNHKYLQIIKKDIIKKIKSENFDYIIDFKRNHKSLQIIKALCVPYKRLHKLNIKKWLYVQFKWNLLPNKHIVERYLETANAFHLTNDNIGL